MSLTDNKPPELNKMPEICPICDSMISLGLISATCEMLPQSEKSRCHQLVKPLEDRSKSAVDTLADILVEIGDENMNVSLDRMNMIIFEATAKAKEKLILAGKIDKSGNLI